MNRLFRELAVGSFTHVIGPLHSWLYHWTGGVIGGSIGGRKALLLTTTGRKTGKTRTRPLNYFPEGEAMFIVASNGGLDHHPGWYFNLKSNPQAQVELGRKTMRVRAEAVVGEERQRLWERVVKEAPVYGGYQRVTEREIPIVMLRPEEDGEQGTEDKR